MMNLLVRYPFLAWLIGAAGLVLIPVGMLKLRDFRHIQQVGATTQGTLVSVEGKEGEHADVSYTFDVAGKHYTGHSEIGAQDRTGVLAGSKIAVKYLPEDPTRNITGKSWPSTPYGFILGGGVCVLLPFSLLVKQRRERRQARR